MSKKLLYINNLSISFGQETVVKNISLSLDYGKSLAIVGESGSGKSLTALSINRLLPDNASWDVDNIIFDHQEISNISPRKMQQLRGRDIAMIFQEPMLSLNPLHRVGQQMMEMITQHSMLSTSQAKQHALQLLDEVALYDKDRIFKSFPHELSGGQRQRVMIAMALAHRPKLLIADEPTTALDYHTQIKIITLLKDIQKKYNLAILFITHDIYLVQRFADNVCVMKDGYIVEHGHALTVLEAPQHDYTKNLIEKRPKPKKDIHIPKDKPILSARDFKIYYPIKKGIFRHVTGYIKAVDGIDIDLYSGYCLGIIGPSGAGKSSLVKGLLQLVDWQGNLHIFNHNIRDLSHDDMMKMRQNIQIVFQDPFSSLSPRMTVGNIIMEGLDVHEPYLSTQEREKRLCDIMQSIHLDPDMRLRYPHEFSGGQRQRIAIGRALIVNPSIIILDEPTSALDVHIQYDIIALLKDLQQKRDLAYIFISHDIDVVKAMADKIVTLENGKLNDFFIDK